jgi:uncharacterized LabA/DUF88 family protein
VLEPVQGDISPADFPETDSRRRRRRRPRSKGSGDGATAAPDADVPPEEPQAETTNEAETQPSGRRRRTRSRRPVAEASETATAELEPVPAAPEPAPRRQPGGAQGRDVERMFSMLESLVARQNVILESFAQRQIQAVRSIERSVLALGEKAGLDFTAASPGGAMPRVGVFVDVPNIIYAAERLGISINFGKLLGRLTRGRALVRASAYAPISDDPQARLEQQKFVQPFVNYGYRIVTKPFKRFADGSIKGNFDVELAMDVLTMSDRLDVVSLVSGDGDFRRLCEIVASKGVRVEVVAFGTSTAGELRAIADDYVDLAEHLEDLAD